MTRKSPLDDPEQAAFAWARYRRIMKVLLAVTIATVSVAMLTIYLGGEPVSIHFYIATALGIGFTMLLAGALMGLVFLSSGTGHDDSVSNDFRDEN